MRNEDQKEESNEQHLLSDKRAIKKHVHKVNKFTEEDKKNEGVSKHTSQSSLLVDSVNESCELWHDSDLVAYITFVQGTFAGVHYENWPLDSKGFHEWLARQAYTELGFTPSREVINSVCNALAGRAKFDGKEYKVFRRVAYHERGYLIDLCNDNWSAIFVTSTGYNLVESPPVKFIRSKTMRSLPMPVQGGDINELWGLINIPEEDRLLVLAWILESFRENTPYLILELIGEQGSAKSTTQKLIRGLVDPNRVALRAAPKCREDIFVAAANGHLISLENLSGISSDISDALCTICTGGGMSSRKHYTNQEESLIESKNPIILNGIGEIITKPDLLDRAIVIALPIIKERKTEIELLSKFEEAVPRIMGALFNLFVGALKELPNVKIPSDQLPRMSDFAYLGEALNIHLGDRPGQFIHKYTQQRQDAIRRTIDASPVATACVRYLEYSQHEGTVGKLYEKLSAVMENSQLEKNEYWPKSPRGLGNSLRRLAPALRQLGIECSIESKPRRDGVHCLLKKMKSEEVEVIV